MGGLPIRTLISSVAACWCQVWDSEKSARYHCRRKKNIVECRSPSVQPFSSAIAVLHGRGPIFFLFLFWFNFKCPQSILNKRIFKKIDNIRFVATWSIFINFLGIFSFFWIQILSFELGRFETGRYRNRSGPVTPVTAVSGPVPIGKKTLAVTSGWC